MRPGPVGIALQSGALASVVLSFARSRATGVSTLVTLGNNFMISTADVLDYLVDDEQTRVICLFLEEIREPDRFARAAEKAARAAKPIVALKAGASPVDGFVNDLVSQFPMEYSVELKRLIDLEMEGSVG